MMIRSMWMHVFLFMTVAVAQAVFAQSPPVISIDRNSSRPGRKSAISMANATFLESVAGQQRSYREIKKAVARQTAE